MDSCFVACGCGTGGLTRSELDHFTDKIENCLNDEKGRNLFRNFMHTSKMHDGRRALGVWEHTEKLLNYKENAESGSQTHRHYVDDVYLLLDKAQSIEEIDFTTLERLSNAITADSKEGIDEALQLLKVEVTKALRREFNAFRYNFVPTSE